MPASIVVKFGGSAITDKTKICTPRIDVIHRASAEIAKSSKRIILLHGGGSYAHPFVSRELVRAGFSTGDGLRSVSEIELNLEQLTRMVGVALLLYGRSFVPIRPMSCITLRNGEVNNHFLQPLNLALRRRTIPILHGDVCVDDARGFGILSADRIASLLGKELSVSRVLFGCDVDGVRKNQHRSTIVNEVTKGNHRGVLNGIRDSRTDATGGMRAKVFEAIRLARGGVESFIFDLREPNNLRLLLDGNSSIGTRFVPWR